MSKFETKVVKIGEKEYPKKLAQCKNAKTIGKLPTVSET